MTKLRPDAKIISCHSTSNRCAVLRAAQCLVLMASQPDGNKLSPDALH